MTRGGARRPVRPGCRTSAFREYALTRVMPLPSDFVISKTTSRIVTSVPGLNMTDVAQSVANGQADELRHRVGNLEIAANGRGAASSGDGRAEVFQPDQINPKGHAGDILAVAFSPDGKTVVTAGSDRLAKVWDVATGSVRDDLAGHEGMISALAFAPGGKVLASSADGDPIVSLWDVPLGRLAATLTLPNPAPGRGVACLVFATDGKTLFTGGERGIAAWDVTSESRALVRTAASPMGQERATLRGHLDAVRSLAVLDGGKALVSRGQGGVIKIWDLSLGRERLTLGGKTLRVRSRACALATTTR